MSASDYLENAILNAVFNNASLAKSARYIKLHIGDPGENGTANAAAETTRKSITGAAAASGTFTSVNNLSWSSLAATENISHFSVWDDVSAGNCLLTGSLVAPIAVTSGGNFTIATGDLVVSVL